MNSLARNSIYISVVGNHLGESAKAVKFECKEIDGTPLDSPKTEWFPLSQVNKIFRDPVSQDTDYLMASQWILEQKGLV